MIARVLVVDDDEPNRRVLARAVHALGYAADVAADGATALERLREPGAAAVDVVVLDLLMPVLDGFQTLQQIKGDPSLEHLPVIVVTGLEDLESAIRCIELGATDYLHKPVQAALLRARLRASLAAKRLRDLELDHLAQVDRVIQAAVAIERGSYDAAGLDGVAERDDALGALARMFQRMAREIATRERALRREVAELRIEIDETRRLRQVAEITGSEPYRRLTGAAADLNRILRDDEDGDG